MTDEEKEVMEELGLTGEVAPEYKPIEAKMIDVAGRNAMYCIDLDPAANPVPGFIATKTGDGDTRYFNLSAITSITVADKDQLRLAEFIAESLGECVGVVRNYE